MTRCLWAGGAVGLALLTACGTTTSEGAGAEQPTPAPTHRLEQTEWQLVEFTRGQTTTTVSVEVDSVLRFDGTGGFSARACNDFTGTARVTTGEVTLRTEWVTAKGCHDTEAEVQAAFSALTRGRLAWSITTDTLHLTQLDGDRLTYRIRSSIYPNLAARTIVAGEHAGFQYQLAVAGPSDQFGLHFHSRAGPGEPWGFHSIGAPLPGESAMWSLVGGDVGDDYFVAGFATADTRRVTHETGNGRPVDLELFAVDRSRWQVFGGFVASHSRASRITAYDHSGRVVGVWPGGA